MYIFGFIHSTGLYLCQQLKFVLDRPARFEADGQKILNTEYQSNTINITFMAGFDQKKLEQLISEMVISNTHSTHENKADKEIEKFCAFSLR